jgi:isovaleryl-CoA dehydrogenase
MAQFRNAVHEFAEREVAPRAAEIDRTNESPMVRPPPAARVCGAHRAQDLWPKLGDMGLLGVTVSPEYGGIDQGYFAHLLAIEELSRASGSVALSYAAHSNLCVNQIHRHGTPAQKEKYLPDLVAGTKVGALAMSEPGAGSDVVSMTLRADKVDDGWKLNGNKFWCVLGAIANGRVSRACQ